MPTMGEAVLDLISTTLTVGLTRICKPLDEGVPVLLAFFEGVLEAGENRPVKSLAVAAGLRIFHRSVEALNTKGCA